jgi:hypothetical protein
MTEDTLVNNAIPTPLALAQPIDDGTADVPEVRSPGTGSTGPKTPRGKRIASLNALRSGLYADAILVKGEDRDEYLRFARAIIASLDVRNAFEMSCAERVVSAMWRARRARRYETSHLNAAADEAEAKLKALRDAELALAEAEGELQSVRRLVDGQRMSADDLSAAACAIDEVYSGLRADAKMPETYWELWPDVRSASGKRVAQIAERVRKMLFVGSLYDFGLTISRALELKIRQQRAVVSAAAGEYEAALQKTFVLDTSPYAVSSAGRVLADAESRLDRQISRAIADLEAARRLRP